MSSVNIVSDDIEMKLVKNHLIGIGIYEKGMSNDEMLDIYKVIKQSEKSASDEEQYRNTLVSTNKNEADLSEVMSENRSLRSNSKIIDKPKKLVEDNNNLSNDSFFPTHNKSNENDKMDNSDFSDTDSDMNKNEQVNGTQSPQKSVKNDIITCYNKISKHIDPFLSNETKYHLKQYNKPYKNEELPIYCRSDILKMPKSLAVKAIMKYHEIMADEHKKFQNQSLNRPRWGKPIPIPIVNKSKANSKSVESPSVTTLKQPTSSDNDIVHEHCLRSRRNVKRKSYTEYFRDDDHFELKKSKEKTMADHEISETKEDDYTTLRNRIFNDLRDTSTEQNLPNFLKDTASSDDEPSVQIEVQALVHNEESANPLKRRCDTVDNGNSKRALMDNSFEDNLRLARGDEIDNSDEEIMENKINNNHVEDKIEQIEDPDCMINSTNDENVYPRRIIPPNLARDISSVRSEQRIKNAARRRNKNPNSITKPENQRTCEDKNEELDTIFEVSPKRFFGPKNKVFSASSALDIAKNDTKMNSNPSRVQTRSIKSKQKTEENEEKCPLCSEYFAASFIEVHAASCALPSKHVTFCPKCDVVYTDFHVCNQDDDVIFDTTKK